MKIGILKEGKIPQDRRVPFTPHQLAEIKKRFEEIEVVVQSSPTRCFTDDEYRDQGIEVNSELSDCDILMGVKEVPVHELIADKTYYFFSHTIKKQAYNRKLLQTILAKGIRLVDYETLTDHNGNRIVAFGRWAGIVGAYNGLWTYGKRYDLFTLIRAKDCFDLEDLKKELAKVKLPAIKIAVTGGGRVAKGAMEVLDGAGIRKVDPSEFLKRDFKEAVYTQLEPWDYHVHKEGKPFELKDFFSNPGDYDGTFLPYSKKADLLIASAFWDPRSPILYTLTDMQASDFKLKVIADITCDIEGSIPSTKKASTIDDPIYDFDPFKNQITSALSNEAYTTVMAIDNLPNELPRDASESFGDQLLQNVIPHFIEDKEQIIKNATIADSGKLTKKYDYLKDFADGK